MSLGLPFPYIFPLYLTYLLHGLTYVVPRVQGFLYFIITFTSTLEIECPTLCSPVLYQRCFQAFHFKSFLMHSSHAFLGQPLGLLPVMIVFSTFLDHLSGSICWRWPYQWRRSHLSTFFRVQRPNQLLSSPGGILSTSFVKQIHLIIIISLLLRRETSSCVAASLNSTEIFFYFNYIANTVFLVYKG